MSQDDNENFEGRFEIFYWRGQKRYRCPEMVGESPCAYDSHELEQLARHVRESHGLKRAADTGITRVSPILGPRGNTVYVEEPPLEFRGARFKREE